MNLGTMANGGMAEWLKAHDSKSCRPQKGLGGSNPPPSATPDESDVAAPPPFEYTLATTGHPYIPPMNFPIEISEKVRKTALEIGLKPEDVEENFTHGHGHGGQKQNKTTNCVELTHRPTGIMVRYQHHRGLHQNRKEAWELLVLKVEEQMKGDQSALRQLIFKIQKQKQRRSRRSKEKMLNEKTGRGEIKALRKEPPYEERTS